MFKAYYLLILCGFLCGTLYGQNSVPNGDFETYTTLPNGYAQYFKSVGWGNVNNSLAGPPFGSPDYFHASGTVGNYFGQIVANSGDAQMGFYTYHNALGDAREYVTTQLTTPLIPGQEYQLTFYLTNGFNGGYNGAADNFGVHFSVGPLTQVVDEVINVIPQIEIPGTVYHSNYWQPYVFLFTATNSADNITFGNFESDAATTITGGTRAYYFIDDIELIPTLPTMQVNSDTTLCLGESYDLNAWGDVSYAWADSLNPSSILSIDSTFTVSPLVSTTYFVYGTMDTLSVSVNVNDPPMVDLGIDTALCGGSLVLDATYAGAAYAWQDGSGNPTFTVNLAGQYSVELTLNGCTAADTIDVVYQPLSLNLGNDTLLCQGEVLTLDATSPNATYTWQDNSGNPTFDVTLPGTYWVTIDNQICTASDTIVVDFSVPEIPNLGNDTILCDGQVLVLDGTTLNGSYLWQDNTTITPTYNATQTGMYSVTVTSGACVVIDSVQVDFIVFPQIDLGPDINLCEGETLVLGTAIPGVNYTWQDGSINPTYTVSSQGIYSVEFGVGTCLGSDTINVNYTIFTVDLGPDVLLCDDATLLLDVTEPGATYLWQDNSTGVDFTVLNEGLYTVEVTVNNCSMSDAIYVSYLESPFVDLGGDRTICEDATFQLNGTGENANSYVWHDNSTLPIFEVSEEGIYSVELTNECGSYNDMVSIEMEDCNCYLYIPNTFTPDGDEFNQTIIPVSNCDFTIYEWTIYNRWGEVIFKSFDPNIGWDGVYSGKSVANDTYTYVLRYSFVDDIVEVLHGHVTVLR
jgi:gliding motility-associated-like protein